MLRILPHRAFVEPAVSVDRIETTGSESTITLSVEGLLCNFCASNVARRLRAVDGVQHAEVDLDSGTATVRYSGNGVQPDSLISAIEAAIVMRPIRHFLAKIGWRGS